MQAKLRIWNSGEAADPWMDDKMCRAFWDSCSRMLLIKDSPAAEGKGGSRCEGKIQVTTWTLEAQDTMGRKISGHLAVRAESRPERRQQTLRLSKISDLLPASLVLNFLMEPEEGSGGRGSCREIADLAAGQRDDAAVT